MTINAAKCLDEAFAAYITIASQDDSSPISRQSPSWYPLTEAPALAATKHVHTSTPYDYAAALVRSLLPYAYNYDPGLTYITQELYTTMVEALEVLPFDHWRVKEILMDKNTRDPYLCDTCGYDEKSSQHYKECATS